MKLTRRRWFAGAAGWSLAAGLNRGNATPGLFAWGGQANASDATAAGLSDPDGDGLQKPGPQVGIGRRYAVATVHPLATDAAMRTFREGGNAADAAVAAALMLSVVDGHNSGLGGGCFILARAADGQVLAIDGREMAPAAAHPEMYFRNGRVDPSLSRTGPLASGVPGAVAAYYRLSTTLGTGRWGSALMRAAEVAEAGFALPPSYARRIASVAEDLRRFPASREIFLRPDGTPPQAGDRIVQADLAGTLRELVPGPDAFYRGRFAESLHRWMKNHGGILTADDLRAYREVRREPVRTTFRGHEVIGFPPPSSGGIHVAQILGLLQRFDLASIANDSPGTFYHLVAEAMRLAFADRAEWLGDPDFTPVPRGLLDEEYLRRRSAEIREDRVADSVAAGDPPDADSRLFGQGPEGMPAVDDPAEPGRHTTHLTAADAAGNWIAITATVNTTLGSKVVIPETGVVMNNEMDDFAIAPGVPNAFGLIGREANAPESGKRPLSSMSPTIVLRDGRPVLTCGAAGGPRIISAAAQIVLRAIGLGQNPVAALSAPRIHHQWLPPQTTVESALDPEIVESLRRKGHTTRPTSAVATAQALGQTPDGRLVAASEPRLLSSRASAD